MTGLSAPSWLVSAPSIDLQSAGGVAGVVGGLVALLTLFGLSVNLPAWWGKLPPVRRRRLKRKLNMVGCGVRAGYVTELLGQQPTFSSALSRPGNEPKVLRELIYVLPDAYVQLVTLPTPVPDEDVIAAWAVTVRQHRFHPTPTAYGQFRGKWGRTMLKLGNTTFASLQSQLAWPPSGVAARVGARRAVWSEAYYAGNPGYYQTYVMGFNDAGTWRGSRGVFPSTDIPGGELLQGSFANPPNDVDLEQLGAGKIGHWRAQGRINTFGVVDAVGDLRVFAPWGLGPNLDRVRLLPQGGSWWSWLRMRWATRRALRPRKKG